LTPSRMIGRTQGRSIVGTSLNRPTTDFGQERPAADESGPSTFDMSGSWRRAKVAGTVRSMAGLDARFTRRLKDCRSSEVHAKPVQ
jgi:hypothetical protein